MSVNKPEPEFIDRLFQCQIAAVINSSASSLSHKSSTSSLNRRKIKRFSNSPFDHLNSYQLFSEVRAAPEVSCPNFTQPKQIKRSSRHHRPVTETSQNGSSLTPKYIQESKIDRKRGFHPINFQITTSSNHNQGIFENGKTYEQLKKLKKKGKSSKQVFKEGKKSRSNHHLRIRTNMTIYKGNFSSFIKKHDKNKNITKMCHIGFENDLSPWDNGQKGCLYH